MRKRGIKEYYLDCSACGDLQDAHHSRAQAEDAVYKHQNSIHALCMTVPGESAWLNVRHAVTIRLRKENE